MLSERWCSDTRRSYFTDHLGFTGKGAINTPAGEPQPWTPPARPRGSGAGPDRQATPLPRASRPWAWSGPAGCHYWPPSPCLRGTATAGASSVSSTGFADGGGTEADCVRSLRRQRPPQAGHLGPHLSSSPYSTRGSRGIRGQLIPDFLSPQSLAYRKRNPTLL